MYFHIKSSDCKSCYPNNSPCDFIYELSQPLYGTYTIGLCEVFGTKLPKFFYVYCDICQETEMFGTRLPLLRCVSKKQVFNPMHFIPIIENQVNRIHLYLRDDKNQNINPVGLDIRFTLEIKKL